MADCHDLFHHGLGAGRPGCNNDHPFGANCCSTPFGPTLPTLNTGPIAHFKPFTKMEKIQIMQQMNAKQRNPIYKVKSDNTFGV